MPRTKRNYAERLAEIEQRETAAKVKIDAIRAEKRRLQNREREKERKARTKRLIEIGAVHRGSTQCVVEHFVIIGLQPHSSCKGSVKAVVAYCVHGADARFR